MSDTAIIAGVTALFAFLTVCAQGYIALVMKRLDTKQEEAKTERAEIKTTLAVTTAATVEKLGEIHTLVNGQRGDVLRSGALSARTLYGVEPNDSNRALMDKANLDLEKHEENEEAIRKKNLSIIPPLPGEEGK